MKLVVSTFSFGRIYLTGLEEFTVNLCCNGSPSTKFNEPEKVPFDDGESAVASDVTNVYDSPSIDVLNLVLAATVKNVGDPGGSSDTLTVAVAPRAERGT